MNERIKELALQAGITVVTEPFDDASRSWNNTMEKFAELIVKECSNVAWQHTPETEELEYSHLIKDKILERFGVKE